MSLCASVISFKSHTLYGAYVLDHLAADGAGFAAGQVAVVALLQVNTDFGCGCHFELVHGLPGFGNVQLVVVILTHFSALLGARKTQRVKQAFYCQLMACVGYTVLFWGLVMLAPQVFAGMFTDDTALTEYTVWALRIYMAAIFALGAQICCQQSFMALGQAKISLLLACLRKIVLLIPLILLLPHFFADQVFAVFLAEPVSDTLAAAVTTACFLGKFDTILKENTTI